VICRPTADRKPTGLRALGLRQMQNPVGHYAGYFGWTRSELPAFRGPRRWVVAI
jgi:hypothetical protein